MWGLNAISTMINKNVFAFIYFSNPFMEMINIYHIYAYHMIAFKKK